MADTMVIGVDPVNGRSKLTYVDHYGPASYTTGGESWPQQSSFGGPNAVGLNDVNWVNGGVTESGNYEVFPIFGGGGALKATIKIKWQLSGAGGPGVMAITSSGGSGMTAGTYALSCGSGSAAGTITVSTSAVTNITITNPGLYTSGIAPTVTAATGGTPPTLTAVLGNTSGFEVPATTNLSAEKIRLAVLGG